jgi:hypothetical protein
MNRFLVIVALMSLNVGAKKSTYKDTIFFGSDNKKIVRDFKLLDDESREEWNATLSVCWKNNRAFFCDTKSTGAKNYDLKCHRSRSANCPDPSCSIKVGEKAFKGVVQASILQGQHRDFIVLDENSSGCGGSSYNIQILGENEKIWCNLNEYAGAEKRSGCL